MKETNTYKKLLNNKRTNNPTKIIVHHTGGTDKYPLADTSHHTAEIMESWHLSKGWDGLGYHFVIHKDGEVWRGRPEHIGGAHTVGHNSTSLGICLSGNFDATLPTKEQEASLKKLLLELTAKYKITEIVPHRKYANKTCYGMKLGDTWAADLIKVDSEHVFAQSAVAQHVCKCPLALADADIKQTSEHLINLLKNK